MEDLLPQEKYVKSIISNDLTDKNTKHSYLEVYEQIFHRIRNTSKPILEIGIFEGGSLKMWNEYFINSTIYGIDSEIEGCPIPSWLKKYNRIKTYKHDAYDLNFIEQEFISKKIQFELIIDDGPHTKESAIFTAQHYSKLLTLEGVLIIEDIQDPTWIDEIISYFPQSLQKNISVIDRRNVKGRFDDIFIICDKFRGELHKARLFNYQGRKFLWMFDPIIKMSWVEANTLFKYCKKVEANIIEIGRYRGGSTIIILEAIKYNKRFKLITIDLTNYHLHPQCKKILEEAKDQVEVIVGHSLKIPLPKNYGIVFIDGEHTEIAITQDFERFWPNLNKEGYIIFHDYTLYYPEVITACNKIMEKYKRTLIKIDKIESLLIVQKIA